MNKIALGLATLLIIVGIVSVIVYPTHHENMDGVDMMDKNNHQ